MLILSKEDIQFFRSWEQYTLNAEKIPYSKYGIQEKSIFAVFVDSPYRFVEERLYSITTQRNTKLFNISKKSIDCFINSMYYAFVVSLTHANRADLTA